MKLKVVSINLVAASMLLSACGGGGDESGDDVASDVMVPSKEVSAKRGKTVFMRCQACHMVEQGSAHGAGPNLHGIFGATAGAKEGFNYSAAMKESGIVWDAKTLDGYIAKPREVIPGTSMAFAGIKNEADRASLMKYLEESTK